MGVNYNPKIVADGLVFAVDAANIKSLPSQNLLLQSENIHLTPWSSLNSATRTQTNINGPLGYGFATRVLTSTTSPSLILQSVSTGIVGVEKIICSVYAKADTSNAFTFNCYYVGDTEINIDFNLSNGTTSGPGVKKIENVGGGWYRCTMEVPARVNTGTSFNWRIWPEPRSSATGKGCLFWGAQLRKVGSSSKYVETQTTTTSNESVLNDLYKSNNLTLNATTSYNEENLGNLTVDGITATPALRLTTTDLPTNQDSTIFCWARPFTPQPNPNTYTGLLGWGLRSSSSSPSTARALGLNTNNPSTFFVSSAYWGNDYVPNNSNVTATTNQWNLIGMISRAQATTNNTTLFKFNSLGYASITGSSSASSRTLNTAQQDLVLGSLESGGARMFNGNIGMTLIYNRELSFSEIQQNINALRGRYGI